MAQGLMLPLAKLQRGGWLHCLLTSKFRKPMDGLLDATFPASMNPTPKPDYWIGSWVPRRLAALAHVAG